MYNYYFPEEISVVQLTSSIIIVHLFVIHLTCADNRIQYQPEMKTQRCNCRGSQVSVAATNNEISSFDRRWEHIISGAISRKTVILKASFFILPGPNCPSPGFHTKFTETFISTKSNLLKK